MVPKAPKSAPEGATTTARVWGPAAGVAGAVAAVRALVAKAAAGEALLPSSSPAAAGGGHGGAPSSLWPSNSSPAAMLSAAMSPQRIKEVATESGEKVVEGALFFARGLKLLGTDVRSSCGLFTRAAAGASLKPREVAAHQLDLRGLVLEHGLVLRPPRELQQFRLLRVC